jgi:hypothetical protein
LSKKTYPLHTHMLSNLRSRSMVLKERGGGTTRSIYKVNIAGHSHYGPNPMFYGGIIADIIKAYSEERKCLLTVIVSHPDRKGQPFLG